MSLDNNQPDKKSKYEGKENLLLGKGQQDTLEKEVLEKGVIEREVIEKKQKKSGAGVLKEGMDTERIKGFLLTNYKYIILAVLFIILVIVLVMLMGSSGNRNGTTKKTTGSAVDVQINDTLELDKYPEVNALVTKYLSAWAASDVNMLGSMVSPFNAEAEKSEIALNKDYIESINNISCYTKQGPVEDSYIVYARYDIKFKGVDTLAPGLINLFIFPTKEGHFIWDYKDYIMSGADVNGLISDVNTKYDEAIASDEKLKERVDGLAAGEALPEATTAPTTASTTAPTTASTTAPTTASTTAPTTAPTTAAPTGNEIQEVNDTLRVTTNVNVRRDMSENSEKIGQLAANTTITRNGKTANGWSRITFNGQTGYVKSEYLSSKMNTTDTVYVNVNVNVRNGASESAQKIGSITPGNNYTRIGQEGDWSIIQYNGTTGYVKSQYLHVR